MKIIHCADIHLGSKLESKFPSEKSKIRKAEILSTFDNMIDYASNNDVKIILLSGDVFDKDKPTKKDKDYFYKCIKDHPSIDFIYLNGNHDKEGSYIQEDIPNLKTFSKKEITTYHYDNIDISGIELAPENVKSFYHIINLNKDKINIFMLHGEISDSMGGDKIKLSSLKNKYIDYLALGHIHSYSQNKIDERGIYAYPGCLEGRGFDECGEKGFILLNIEDKISLKFIPFAKRTIYELDIDVTNCKSLYDLNKIIKNKVSDIDFKNILRIHLIGELSLDFEFSNEDITSKLSNFFFVNVKNDTSIKINYDDYKNDISLKGEFVRQIYNNDNYTLEEKNQLISLGLKFMENKEVD